MIKNKRLLILAIIALFLCAVIVSVAYMFKNTNLFVNTLEHSVVQCAVVENFDQGTGVKSSVMLRNTGNIDEFLRVRLISYWVDAEGNVLGKPSVMPAVNYDEANWIKADDDTYYYKYSVTPNELSAELLISPVQLATDVYSSGDGTQTVYQVLEVIPEAIQSKPAGAAHDMWGVTVNGNSITGV